MESVQQSMLENKWGMTMDVQSGTGRRQGAADSSSSNAVPKKALSGDGIMKAKRSCSKANATYPLSPMTTTLTTTEDDAAIDLAIFSSDGGKKLTGLSETSLTAKVIEHLRLSLSAVTHRNQGCQEGILYRCL